MGLVPLLDRTRRETTTIKPPNRQSADTMTDTPPPIPTHLRTATPWWNTKVPVWTFVPFTLVIFLALAAGQRPLVEALWRKHHPFISDGMRAGIQQVEERSERERYDEQMRKINNAIETPTPQRDDQTAKSLENQNEQYQTERTARRERLGLPPLSDAPSPSTK